MSEEPRVLAKDNTILDEKPPAFAEGFIKSVLLAVTTD